MSILDLSLRLILIAVLALAGVAKLADRDGARRAITGFGVPEGLSVPLARMLPLAELAGAGLLIVSATARLGAALALILMVCFCAAITRSLLRGEAPECHCFGAIHSEPAGPRTLIRNLVLAAAAAAVLAAGPGLSATAWLNAVPASTLAIGLLGLALVAALAGGGRLVLNLLRRNGELLLRVDELEEVLSASGLIVAEPEAPAASAGLPIGSPAPDFELPGLDGTPAALPALRADAPDGLLLIFSDPACGPCSALMPEVAEWQRERPGGLRPVLISRGTPEANRAHAEEHDLQDILIQTDREVAEAFAVSATPSALILAADGTVASAVHAGAEQIHTLLSRPGSAPEVVLPIHRPTAGPGQLAPDPALRTLEGKLVRLAQKLPDEDALVVFWNPDCGFCERMLPALRELDAHEPGLVVISTGSPSANRAIGLRAPVLLDEDFSAGRAFGAAGTPSAVRISAAGRIDSPVAVGAEAIAALAGPQPVAA